MFARRFRVECIARDGSERLCPVSWIDSFAMRNFTNDAIFDDTLPIEDGLLEAGHRVPLPQLTTRMEDWFRRKSYLAAEETLRIEEILPVRVPWSERPDRDRP